MIHEFRQRGSKGTLRVAIDMTRVEAVMQDEGWTCIVSGTDTYYVEESYATVLAAWLSSRREG